MKETKELKSLIESLENSTGKKVFLKENEEKDNSQDIIKAFKKVGLKGVDTKSVKKSVNYPNSYVLKYVSSGGLFSIENLINLKKSLNQIGADSYSFSPSERGVLMFFVRF